MNDDTNQQLEEEPGVFVCVLPADPSADNHLQGQLLVKLLQNTTHIQLTHNLSWESSAFMMSSDTQLYFAESSFTAPVVATEGKGPNKTNWWNSTKCHTTILWWECGTAGQKQWNRLIFVLHVVHQTQLNVCDNIFFLFQCKKIKKRNSCILYELNFLSWPHSLCMYCFSCYNSTVPLYSTPLVLTARYTFMCSLTFLSSDVYNKPKLE